MFSFFKPKKAIVTDLSWIGTDIHSHLLPGIDDGSPDVETSLMLFKGLNELGFNKFICTPHIFKELYPNNRQTIMPALQHVKQALEERGVNITVEAAAEYMMDQDFVISDEMLTLGDKYLLIEMSYLSEYPNIEQVIFDLQIRGYQIILAHPERYNFYHGNLSKYRRLKDMGCLFQLNLLSITGYYGKQVKEAAEELLKFKLYDLTGTDLHHEKHLQALQHAAKIGVLFSKVGHYQFLNKDLFG